MGARRSRSQYAYRARIRQVILDRMVRGDTLGIREIIAEAGGGSMTTVRDELAKCPVPTDAVRVGLGAKSPAQRIALLETAINESLARERSLTAENQALRSALDSARTDVEKLLLGHQDSQRLLLQGVDDLRQMVRAAGQGGLPAGIIEAERHKAVPPVSDDTILWKARHDKLLARLFSLEARCNKMAGRLHDLGVDFDLE